MPSLCGQVPRYLSHILLLIQTVSNICNTLHQLEYSMELFIPQAIAAEYM